MPIVIEGKDKIELARWLSVRMALSVSIRTGMRRHGRSARILANEITGESHSSNMGAYDALNRKIISVLGPGFDRPI